MIDCFQIYIDNLKISIAATHHHERLKILVMCYAIWYHLYNLKSVKNTHEGVLLLAKLQAKSL